MGIRAIIDALRGGVVATAPRSIAHVGFTTRPGAYPSDPDEWAEDARHSLRDFIVALEQYPHQGSDTGPCRLLAVLNVVVAYPLRELPGDEVPIVVAEDAARLSEALVGVPTHWGGADSIWTEGPPVVETYATDDGRPIHITLTIPLRVRFREA
jgi:hypothetical protein